MAFGVAKDTYRCVSTAWICSAPSAVATRRAHSDHRVFFALAGCSCVTCHPFCWALKTNSTGLAPTKVVGQGIVTSWLFAVELRLIGRLESIDPTSGHFSPRPSRELDGCRHPNQATSNFYGRMVSRERGNANTEPPHLPCMRRSSVRQSRHVTAASGQKCCERSKKADASRDLVLFINTGCSFRHSASPKLHPNESVRRCPLPPFAKSSAAR